MKELELGNDLKAMPPLTRLGEAAALAAAMVNMGESESFPLRVRKDCVKALLKMVQVREPSMSAETEEVSEDVQILLKLAQGVAADLKADTDFIETTAKLISYYLGYSIAELLDAAIHVTEGEYYSFFEM